ncbi:MAG TPA: RHS repeat-associated core domain-containing protein, partial [Blastocatellia bacterium]|nr:RHS repeat-associated core domain-containing protein [Blastocatellia bacterium]
TPGLLTPRAATDFSTSSNRITLAGFFYDAAGNLTNDNTGAALAYDGDGRRVQKVAGGVTVVYVYNAQGQLIAEYDTGTPPAGGTKYLTADHLGSTRVVTNGSGAVVARHDFLPFGEELDAGIGGRTTAMGYSVADTTRQRFTSKERDTESGLDYFGTRYYSSLQGRFMSADAPFAGQDEQDPQTWNLYAYTSNNPLNRYDPDGQRWFYKEENGKIVDVVWVDANADGTYTSPGEGYTEFIPTEERPYLRVTNEEGTVAYRFGEGKDGSPIAFGLDTGRTRDASGDLILGAIGLRLSAKAAAGVWSWYNARRKADRLKLGPKNPRPATPGGMTPAQFGQQVMRWGRSSAEARQRIATLTREELENAGVTKEIAQAWREFYRKEMARNPANPSAAGRAELMDRAVKLLGGK